MASGEKSAIGRMTGPELWQAGQAQVLQGRVDLAIPTLQALLAMHPGQVGARMLLAAVLLSKGSLRAAIAQMNLAASMLPDDAALVARVAQGLSRLGEVNGARSCLRHPAIPRTTSGPVLTALAHVFQGLGLNPQALQLMDKARDGGYDNPDFRYFRALQLQFNGRLADAKREMEARQYARPAQRDRPLDHRLIAP